MHKLYNKYKLIILAILIALLLWFYVNNQNESLLGVASFGQKNFLLPLEINNLPQNYKISNISNKNVVIRLGGIPFYHSYDKQDFRAYVDLNDVNKGDNLRKVKIEAPSGAKIKGIDPTFVRITVYKVKE